MKACKPLLCSSVGQKLVVAGTGLLLGGFVLSHMTGNLLMFVSAEAYNKYGHSLVSMPFFPVIELGLLAVFLTHMIFAARLTFENRKARPLAPMAPKGCHKTARFGSRYMALSGAVVAAFVVLHVKTFRFGPVYHVEYGGVPMRDLYALLEEVFRDPVYVGWYVFSLLLLFVHLAHGFSALTQTLGFASVRSCLVKKIGYALAGVVALGFIAQPLYFFCCGGN